MSKQAFCWGFPRKFPCHMRGSTSCQHLCMEWNKGHVFFTYIHSGAIRGLVLILHGFDMWRVCVICYLKISDGGTPSCVWCYKMLRESATRGSWCARTINHGDVIKWKHFPRYWPFVQGIHRSPVNSPHKGQWRGALMFSLICTRINGWENNGEAGDLRRHRVDYVVTVMCTCIF